MKSFLRVGERLINSENYFANIFGFLLPSNTVLNISIIFKVLLVRTLAYI